ncbi:MAG: hypothetical protein OCD01_17065 [Fibrobacterales bacterium]
MRRLMGKEKRRILPSYDMDVQTQEPQPNKRGYVSQTLAMRILEPKTQKSVAETKSAPVLVKLESMIQKKMVVKERILHFLEREKAYFLEQDNDQYLREVLTQNIPDISLLSSYNLREIFRNWRSAIVASIT